MIYVHIGAGAGDLDAGALFRDGFSEFVKQIDDDDKRIYVVEANPSNISKLELAERVGFEPTKELPLYTLSKRALSTTQPSLLL